jgi:phosphate acetyltransferase
VTLLEKIREKAAKRVKTIVLPETDDPRTIEAAGRILDRSIARLILIGKEDVVAAGIKSGNKDLIRIIDPATFKDTAAMAAEYYEMRKAKGVSPEEARETVAKDYVTFGAMLVRRGLADGFVAGANHTTPDVIRAALRCLPIDKSIGVVSGAFLMGVPSCEFGAKGVFVFADCGVNPNPNARQLAGIAVSSASLFKQLVGETPRVALLSYSSQGSAHGEMVDKVVEAVKRAREIAPNLALDGEFQADSAIVPEIAKIKCSKSDVAGRANVLIFPDLNSGNICYKLTQRLAKARAIGPLLQGFTKPCSDLSRGCNADDIVDAVAITSLRA